MVGEEFVFVVMDDIQVLSIAAYVEDHGILIVIAITGQEKIKKLKSKSFSFLNPLYF